MPRHRVARLDDMVLPEDPSSLTFEIEVLTIRKFNINHLIKLG